MSFFDHLEELRWRIFRIVLSILIFSSLAFIFKEFIFDNIIFAPTQDHFIFYTTWCKVIDWLSLSKDLCLGNIDLKFINTEIAGQFMVHIKTAMYIGVILAFPYFVFELWLFISPGLHEHERKASRAAILISSLLFFIGICFGYYIITPFSIDFLSDYVISNTVDNTITITNYLGFVSTLVLASGIMFQLPMIVFLLAKIGVVSASMMKEYWKYAFVLSLALSAFITPPDMASMFMVAFPLFSLYLFSIIIAQRVNP